MSAPAGSACAGGACAGGACAGGACAVLAVWDVPAFGEVTCPLSGRWGLMTDRGSGTVWVVGLMAVIWLVAVTTMVAGGVRAARHRAHAAADGAALAAAAHASQGPAAACRIAAAVAAGTGARLTGCVLRAQGDGAGPGGMGPGGMGFGGIGGGGDQLADVSVVVAYRGPVWLGTLRIPARARAAPTRSQSRRSGRIPWGDPLQRPHLSGVPSPSPPVGGSVAPQPERTPVRPRGTPLHLEIKPPVMESCGRIALPPE
jgi:secretion/DNA translocation related TadE-like protein